MAQPIADRRSSPAGKNRPGKAVVESWEAHCLREMALAMGGWLQTNNDLNKPVHRLSLRELQGMAWAAAAKYTELREIERLRHDVSLLDEKSLDDMGFVIRGD